MRHVFFGLCIFFSSCGWSQDLSRFIETNVGKGFVQVPKNVATTRDSVSPVYSRTTQNVVIGHVFNGEFVLHADSVRAEKSQERLIGTTYISKAEFLEFREWIRDSIAREKIYFGLENDEEAAKFLDLTGPSEHVYYKEIEYVPSNRDINREIYGFNWGKKFQYDDPNFMPILADMYYPRPERFRKNRTIDFRKMYYRANDELRRTWSWYPILIDSYNWALGEQHNFSPRSVLAFLDDQLYRNDPITNIEPFMALAYCHWKSKQLTEILGSQKMNIVCRLPNASEVEYIQKSETSTLEIPAYDHTVDWTITNSEFNAFSAYVLDSSRREYLYNNLEDDEDALALLNFTERYFSEGGLEFVQIKPRERAANRWYFNFDFKKKLNSINPRYTALLNDFSSQVSDSIQFRYSWMEAIHRSVKGELVLEQYRVGMRYNDYLVLARIEGMGDGPRGEDLILDGWGREDGFGTRDHANYQRFIRQEIIALPLPATIPTDESIADITYEQALAYYNWKFRIDQYSGDETGNWQQFVFPTEAEFERVKKGERIVHPATSIAYEFPVFRMVVEVVSK